MIDPTELHESVIAEFERLRPWGAGHDPRLGGSAIDDGMRLLAAALVVAAAHIHAAVAEALAPVIDDEEDAGQDEEARGS